MICLHWFLKYIKPPVALETHNCITRSNIIGCFAAYLPSLQLQQNTFGIAVDFTSCYAQTNPLTLYNVPSSLTIENNLAGGGVRGDHDYIVNVASFPKSDSKMKLCARFSVRTVVPFSLILCREDPTRI